MGFVHQQHGNFALRVAVHQELPELQKLLRLAQSRHRQPKPDHDELEELLRLHIGAEHRAELNLFFGHRRDQLAQESGLAGPDFARQYRRPSVAEHRENQPRQGFPMSRRQEQKLRIRSHRKRRFREMKEFFVHRQPLDPTRLGGNNRSDAAQDGDIRRQFPFTQQHIALDLPRQARNDGHQQAQRATYPSP